MADLAIYLSAELLQKAESLACNYEVVTGCGSTDPELKDKFHAL